MASNLKKAGSVIRNSFRSKRYIIFDAEENNYILSPQKPEKRPDRDSNGLRKSFRSRKSNNVQLSASSSDENENVSSLANVRSVNTSITKSASVVASQPSLKRTTSVTKSMRVAVGVLREKLKISTKRGQQQITPKRAGKRQPVKGDQEVSLYSPFKIDTPKGSSRRLIKTWKTLLLTNNRLRSPRSTSKRVAS